MDYVSIPPSGGRTGTFEEVNTADFNENGESITIPNAANAPFIRYLTFHFEENYRMSNGVAHDDKKFFLTAIEIYGQPKNKKLNK
jgi:hypothetical protein